MSDHKRELLFKLEVELTAQTMEFCKKWGKDKLKKVNSKEPEELLLELRTLKFFWKDLKERAETSNVPINPDIDKLFREELQC